MRMPLVVSRHERPIAAAWRLSALAALLASGSFAAGACSLRGYLLAGSGNALRAPAGVLLVVAGLVQSWLACAAWHNKPRRSGPAVNWRPFGRQSVVGAVACYALTLAIGGILGPRHPGLGSAFAAGLSIWLTILLLPLAASVELIEQIRKLLGRRGPRRVGLAIYFASLFLMICEGTLRVTDWLPGLSVLRLPASYDVTVVQHANRAAVSTVADSSRNPPSIPFDTDGVTQMAILESERLPAESPFHSDSWVGRPLPGVEIVRLSMNANGLGLDTKEGLTQIRELRPNLLLAFVSVADDIEGEPAGRDPFDWRALGLTRAVQLCVGWQINGSELAPVESQPAAGDEWNRFVAACSPQLSICRKPMDGATQQRWKTTLGRFDSLVDTCRSANISLALVVIPSPLQTSRPLLDAVCRRTGCTPGDVDLELPQRRLAAYAADRKLPLCDLLPALRSVPTSHIYTTPSNGAAQDSRR